MSKLNYFAYGSNMSSRRLRARIPSAKAIGTAILGGHRLVFQKVGLRDGSAKCDVVVSVRDKVYGVLFTIAEAEKPILDRFEGLKFGYDEKAITVTLKSGAGVAALTYFATETNPNLKPFSWYKHHVLQGARAAEFPHAYMDFLERIPAIEDPDKEREATELAIYGSECAGFSSAMREVKT